mgnify:CR=1 FL=1
MPYIGKSPSAGVRQRYQYTATAGQTTFSGTDLGNLTLTYTDNNFVDVFQNGVLLKGGGTDYTATSGTSVVLATGASVSDVIEIIVYDVFSVGNFFNRTDSDSRYLSAAKGIDDQTSSNDDQLTITDTAVVINEDSDDVDFRVESNGNANMLVVDGGNDVMAIGRAVVTSATLAIQNKDDTNNNALDIYNDNGNRNISIQQDTSGNGKFMVINNAGNNMHRFDADGAIYRIGNESPATNGHIRMADSGGYTMDWMGTGTRTYVFRGATSGGNYTTTFDNPGGGVHNLTIDGALSKGSGSFKIDHPLESKRDTNWLVHSFLEGPQADLIYRGSVKLSSGSATVDIDTASGMTSGTFEALCTNVQCFTSNETGWTAIKGSVSGKTLTITAQDNSCTDTISWMVVGERNDTHMKKADWTDADGRVIVEPTRDAPPKEETPKEGRE